MPSSEEHNTSTCAKEDTASARAEEALVWAMSQGGEEAAIRSPRRPPPPPCADCQGLAKALASFPASRRLLAKALASSGLHLRTVRVRSRPIRMRGLWSPQRRRAFGGGLLPRRASGPCYWKGCPASGPRGPPREARAGDARRESAPRREGVLSAPWPAARVPPPAGPRAPRAPPAARAVVSAPRYRARGGRGERATRPPRLPFPLHWRPSRGHRGRA